MSKFKFWRLSNIRYLTSLPTASNNGSIASLRFMTAEYIESTPATGTPISESYPYDFPEGKPINAFNNDPLSHAMSEYASRGKGLNGWWIGFEFKKAVRVTSVTIGQANVDGHVWQSADVDCSADGIVWNKYAEVHPNLEPKDFRLKFCPLVNLVAPPKALVFQDVDEAVKSFKYWKFVNPVYTAEGTEGISLKSFRLHYTEEDEATDPSKLTIYNEGANKEILFNPRVSSSVYRSSLDIRHKNWFLQYEFNFPVKLLGVTIEYDETRPNTRFASLDVLGSNDNEDWELVSKTSFPNINSVVKSIDRPKPFTSIGSFVYNPDVPWWKSVLTANCLFALDAESEIRKDGEELVRRDDESKVLKLTSRNTPDKGVKFQPKKVAKILRRGQQVLGEYEPLSEYKSLLFSNELYELFPTVTDVNDFTFIIRFKPRSLQRMGPWLLVQTNDHTLVTKGASGYVSGYSVISDSLNFFACTYDSLRGVLKEYGGTGIRPGGEHIIPPTTSAADSISYYKKEFRYFGSEYWEVRGDLVAVGIWDTPLTEEEIFKVLSQIDGKFVGKELHLTLNSLKEKIDYLDLKLNKEEEFLEEVYDILKYPKFKDDLISEDVFFRKAVIANAPYKKLFTISDIVTKEDVPVVSKLNLYEKYSGELIANTWSNPKGQFSFKGLESGQEYIITSWDKDLEYRSIIKDYN